MTREDPREDHRETSTEHRPVGGRPYAERLWVPPMWWLFGAFLLATLWLAYAAFLGDTWANLVAGSAAALVGLGLAAYGSAPIRVEADSLRAGRARMPWRAVGAATSLTREQAARMRGPEANAAAYHLIRPYLRRAVLVEVADPADPTPYWYVATRRPERLAEAIDRARAGAEPA